jgi:hypothetical protein
MEPSDNEQIYKEMLTIAQSLIATHDTAIPAEAGPRDGAGVY